MKEYNEQKQRDNNNGWSTRELGENHERAEIIALKNLFRFIVQNGFDGFWK